MTINKRKLRKLGETVTKEGANQYDWLIFNLASNVLTGSETTTYAAQLLKDEGILCDEAVKTA